MSDNVTFNNWFAHGGSDYARYRPEYPAALGAYLAGLVTVRASALDVGCGTGQLTGLLAEHFASVVGTDPSESQLASAEPHPAIRYVAAPAEQLPEELTGFNLITVAQAAHWFDLDAFYREARRVSAPGGILALISYGVMQLDEELQQRFHQFYYDEIGPYWPAERQLVDEGYRTLAFPFTEIPTQAMTINLAWPLKGLLGYISTWSAVKRAQEAGKSALVEAFSQDIRRLWGNPETLRQIVWPINMRVGAL